MLRSMCALRIKSTPLKPIPSRAPSRLPRLAIFWSPDQYGSRPPQRDGEPRFVSLDAERRVRDRKSDVESGLRCRRQTVERRGTSSRGPTSQTRAGSLALVAHRFARDLPGARRCGNYGCAWHADTLSHRPRPSSCARRPARLMSVLWQLHAPGPTALLGHGGTATALKTAEPEHRFSPTEKREVHLGPNPARRGRTTAKQMCSKCGIPGWSGTTPA
jgi:hypothetical protein